MKKSFVLFIVCVFCIHLSFAQKLTLSELTNLCNKTNWETINEIMLSKGWAYYDSEKGDTFKYNTITWSYNKDYYTDKANAWFYLYTYEGYPNKISYTILNKESYYIIFNSISKAGYKLVDSEINDNELISTYTNQYYILKISTEKRIDEDLSDRSVTAYTFTLIKKSGIYDEDNGHKYEYYDDNTVKYEYNLKNGKLHGAIKVYHENGKLKKTGSYENGNATGKFTEYDEDGNLICDYYLLNDSLDGTYNQYADNKLSTSTNYINGSKNGRYTDYYYNTGSGECYGKIYGDFKNNEKTGQWVITVIKDGTEKVVDKDLYVNGMKNGPFQHSEGDSLIIGNYSDNKRNGQCKTYVDLNRMIYGGIINTDTTKLILISEGYYVDDEQTGFWKYYDYKGALNSEGKLVDGLKNGVWNYYYSDYEDESGNKLPFSRALFLSQTYRNNQLNGRSIRKSNLYEEAIPCNKPNANPLDSCTKYTLEKVSEVANYENDVLNGPYELRDSTNTIITSGYYSNGKKNGEWIYRFAIPEPVNRVNIFFEKGKYTNDNREGEWISYNSSNHITHTYNFKNGLLHGKLTDWNNSNTPEVNKYFDNGKLTQLIRYDDTGVSPQQKYEIYDVTTTGFTCRKTDYLTDGYFSQEYKIMSSTEIDHRSFESDFEYKAGAYSNGKSGYKEGNFLLFNKNDQPLISGHYDKGNKNGLWTTFYYDQQIKIESNYENNNILDEKYLTFTNDLYSGKFIYEDTEKNIREERKIKDGLRNGKTTFIDTKTKKTIKKENYKNGVIKL